MKKARTSTVALPSNASVVSKGAVPKRLLEVVKTASAAAPAPVILGMALRPQLTNAAVKSQIVSATCQTSRIVAATEDHTKPMSFAQAVSGSSKAPNILSPPQIKCRCIPPRPPPSDLDGQKSKPETVLQDAFERRWHSVDHGVLIEYVRGTSQVEYLGAIVKVVGPQVFSIGMTGRGTVSVYLNTVETAQKLMLEGIQLAGRHLTPYPEAVKPRRVVLSRVPLRVDNEDILTFLRKFGTIHGKMRAIPIKLGENGLGKGVFSLSREVFISMKQGCKLPPALIIDCDGVKTYVDITTEARCFRCQQVGHLIADCPKRQNKPAEGNSVPSAESTQVPNKAKPIRGTDSLEGQLAMGGSQVVSPKRSAGTEDIPPLPQETNSSADEGVGQKIRKKRKKIKRRKKLNGPGTMPPPALPTEILKASTFAGVKRARSEEEVLSPKRRVSEILDTGVSDLSDCETMLSVDTNDRSAVEMGYQSAESGSASSVGSLSLRGAFDVVPRCSSWTREQICSLLKKLYRKQNESLITKVIYEFTDDPESLVPQIKSLQDRARGNKNYNEATRLDRVLKKIELAVANRALEGSSSL